MRDPEPITHILSALRSAGAEYELTQAIAAFANADEAFGSALARVLIEATPSRDNRLLDAIPATVRCTPERRLYDGQTDYGPVDLLFEEADWGLLVENKLYSGYGKTQLDRYLSGGAALGLQHWGLLAITRDEPASADEPPTGTRGWLGSVRWAAIVDRLASLRFDDERLASLWQSLLDVEIENGDFGMSKIDRDVVRGWATWQEGRDQLATLLRGLVDPTLAAVTKHLSDGRSCDWHQHASSSGLWLWADSIHARFRIPAGATERLRVEFCPAEGGALYFWVSAWMEDIASLSEAAQEAYRSIAGHLREEAAFEVEDRHYSFITHGHPEELWLREDGHESVPLLHDLIRADVAVFADAGVFDGRFDLPRM